MSSAILIIEDDESLSRALTFRLGREGYRVTPARDGLEGLRAARFCQPDLVILDLMLPQIDGRQVCTQLRSWSDTPILVLTAVDDESETVEAFQAGADDYMTKPFRMRELCARIQALLRRTRGGAQPEPAAPDVLMAGKLTLRSRAFRATFADRELRLPPKEFKLLSVLARQPDRVFTRMELLDLVWGEDVIVDPRNVDVHIRAIRAQLEGEPDGSHLIETVHGVGYRFAGGAGPRDEQGDRWDTNP